MSYHPIILFALSVLLFGTMTVKTHLQFSFFKISLHLFSHFQFLLFILLQPVSTVGIQLQETSGIQMVNLNTIPMIIVQISSIPGTSTENQWFNQRDSPDVSGSKLNTHCSGFCQIPHEQDWAFFPTGTYKPQRLGCRYKMAQSEISMKDLKVAKKIA